MRTRVAIVVTLVVAIYLFAFPVSAAPAAQTTLPDFTLNAQTTISVTVAITGGQVIVVPVDVTFIAQNDGGTPEISIITGAEQQAGMYIGIASPSDAPATLHLGLVDPLAPPTPVPAAVADGADLEGGNTYVVNANANLRAGPGTNFEIVGKPRFGDIVVVAGQNEDGTWMQLEGGGWIAAFLLDPTEDNSDDAEESNTEESNAAQATATPALPTPPPPAQPTQPPAAAQDQSALAAYLLQAADSSTDVNSAVPILRALIQNPQPFNDQWRGQVTAQLAAISAGLDRFLALTPVPGYEDLHAQVTNTTAVCEQGIDYIASGLDDPRSFSPTLAADLMESCAIQTTNLAGDIQALQ